MRVVESSAALNRAAELARQSVEILESALVVVDARGEVALANRAARQLGIVDAHTLFPASLYTLVEEARARGEACTVELEAAQTGREALPLRVTATSLGAEGDVALHAVDITEEQRLAAVRRDFVANISHELKTPVGGLALLAEAIVEATDDPEAVHRFAVRIKKESKRLSRLVTELIELSRLQGADPLPNYEVIPVESLLAEVLERITTRAESHRITIDADGEGRLCVAGSRTQLITALTNLVENAISYSPSGSTITIATRARDHGVEITVADQGMGIAERDVDRIFERFYRADPARSRDTGGTGLGLAIVKHIAMNHGGSIDVSSVLDSGSVFTLRLPEASS